METPVLCSLCVCVSVCVRMCIYVCTWCVCVRVYTCVSPLKCINQFFHAVSSLSKTQWQWASDSVAATQTDHPRLQDASWRQHSHEHGATEEHHQWSPSLVLHFVWEVQLSTHCWYYYWIIDQVCTHAGLTSLYTLDICSVQVFFHCSTPSSRIQPTVEGELSYTANTVSVVLSPWLYCYVFNKL